MAYRDRHQYDMQAAMAAMGMLAFGARSGEPKERLKLAERAYDIADAMEAEGNKRELAHRSVKSAKAEGEPEWTGEHRYQEEGGS